MWLCRETTRKLIRQEWTAEFGIRGELITTECILTSVSCLPRLSYFLSMSSADDLSCLASVCQRFSEMLSSQDKTAVLLHSLYPQRLPLVPHRSTLEHMLMLLDRCLEAVEKKGTEWIGLLLASRLDTSQTSRECYQILNFLQLLLDIVNRKNEHFRIFLNHLAQHLHQKDIFGQFVAVIRQAVTSFGVQTIENSLLEQLLINVINLDRQLEPNQLTDHHSYGAFRLWSIPSLSSFSPAIVERAPILLRHAVPFFRKLAATANKNEDLSLVEPSSILMKGMDHVSDESCYALSNLLDLGQYKFLQTSDGNVLCSEIVQFVDWVIFHHKLLLPDDQKLNELSDDDSYRRAHPFLECADKLIQYRGQQFLVSLTEGLLPESRMAPFSSEFTLRADGSALLRILDLAYTISSNNKMLESIRSFSITGKMVSILWFGLISRIWRENRNASTLVPSLSVIQSLISPLIILCEIYSSFLLVAGDTEIIKRQIPLPLTEIYNPQNVDMGLIFVLKNCFWQLVWTRPVTTQRNPQLEKSISNFANKAGKLLCQLYDIVQRWNIAPDEQFHLPDSQIHLFMKSSKLFLSSSHADLDLSNHSIQKVWHVLTQCPCLIPFYDRVKILQSQLSCHRPGGSATTRDSRGIPVFQIRRNYVLEDAFDLIGQLEGHHLRKRIRIEFIDEHGFHEAGVDGGGLFKEFLEELCKNAFSPNYGLFTATDQHEIYPNPAAIYLHQDGEKILTFLGKIVGKAVYDGILVELPFAHFFLKKFRRQLCDFHDLPSLDRSVYQNLKNLKESKRHVQELGLNFTITENTNGFNEEVELKEGGKQIQVTVANVLEYVYRFADYRLNREGKLVCSAFLKGFFEVLEHDWIQMFNASELQKLISGSAHIVDIEDLRASVVYAGGYHEAHPVILAFWEVMKSLSNEQQRQFLRFVTGCSRAPLLGFEQLQPKMCIRMSGTEDGPDIDRLPTSATCANLLKLPAYPSMNILKEKLFYAISAKCGFELS